MAKVLENDKARRNIIVDLYRERGLIDPNQEAAGYAPHFDMADMLGESKTGPTSTGMDNVVAGKVQRPTRACSPTSRTGSSATSWARCCRTRA